MHGAERFKNMAKPLAGLLLALALFDLPAWGQSPSSPEPMSPEQKQPAGDATLADTPYLLRMTTREVVIGVVAVDQRNHPVSDMKESEFELYLVQGWPLKSRRAISAFRVIDPALPKPHSDAPSGGFRIASSERCAVGRSSHYEIAFQPAPGDSTGGYHDVLVTTSRPHIKLLFQRHYYVGETKVHAKPEAPEDRKAIAVLQQAACFHPATPASISLAVLPPQTGSAGSLRYSLIVQADSLAFISLSEQARRVQLDVGVCTFDGDGIPLWFTHTSIDRELTPSEYQRALVLGFRKQLEFTKQEDPALVRFVVRDRRTGNLGTLSVTIPHPAQERAAREQREAARKLRENQAEEDRKIRDYRTDYLDAKNGLIHSFGSILAQSGGMCGDVYELPQDTRALPDFWSLDPAGIVYAYQLDLPAQHNLISSAIPGVTKRFEWFGVDYYGEFWIDAPGDYTFQLFADDGAKLYIDGNQLINLDSLHIVWNGEARIHLDAGRHELHLPYFQGPQGLALMLLVKPPGGEYKIFDLRDFAAPAGESEGGLLGHL
jgi:hypothetical protein